MTEDQFKNLSDLHRRLSEQRTYLNTLLGTYGQITIKQTNTANEFPLTADQSTRLENLLLEFEKETAAEFTEVKL